MRLVTLKSDGHEVKVGNEVVLFRHEKTFYNRPGVFIKVRDDEDVKAKVEPADKFVGVVRRHRFDDRRLRRGGDR